LIKIQQQEFQTAIHDPKLSGLRRRALQHHPEEAEDLRRSHKPVMNRENSDRRPKSGSSISIAGFKFLLKKTMNSGPKPTLKSIEAWEMDTIVSVGLLCVNTTFSILSFLRPSEAGLWNNFSQAGFYLLSSYLHIRSSSRTKNYEANGGSRSLSQWLLYCSIVCMCVSAVVYSISVTAASGLTFVSNLCQILAIKLVLENRIIRRETAGHITNSGHEA
jgi:hypothetical protein